MEPQYKSNSRAAETFKIRIDESGLFPELYPKYRPGRYLEITLNRKPTRRVITDRYYWINAALKEKPEKDQILKDGATLGQFPFNQITKVVYGRDLKRGVIISGYFWELQEDKSIKKLPYLEPVSNSEIISMFEVLEIAEIVYPFTEQAREPRREANTAKSYAAV